MKGSEESRKASPGRSSGARWELVQDQRRVEARKRRRGRVGRRRPQQEEGQEGKSRVLAARLDLGSSEAEERQFWWIAGAEGRRRG